MATSGDYMNSFTTDFRLHHILDPHTLESPAELASATVIAPTAMEADALSTALMVLGSRRGLALVEPLSQVEALLVGKNLKIYRSIGFPN
jgi:thiamine biosynthesis lipoprotein